MCLVSYIPLKDGYVLSSNRDESPSRAATQIQEETIANENIEYPIDIKGGSWIIKSDKLKVACILNGAFKNHERHLPYKISRGIMMKSFFKFKDAVDFFENYNFWNIEPFTMVIVQNHDLFEFRWDGSAKYILTLDKGKTHIWSSCTLYDDATQQDRARILGKSLKSLDLSNDHLLLQAHIQRNPDNLVEGLFIDRGIVKTISHTQVRRVKDLISMKHYNLTK